MHFKNSDVDKRLMKKSGTSILLNTCNETICNWPPKSLLARKLIGANIIILEKISMVHRSIVKTVERLLWVLRQTDTTFGGISIIFGGDSSQTLPVIRGGSFLEQGFSSGLNSDLSLQKNSVNCLQLTLSMLQPSCHPNSTCWHM